VLNGSYETLLPAIAGCAAALIGLLFVAMSVTGRRRPDDRPVVVEQVRAAAAILSFSNAITVALFGLVPGNNIGYPATVVAVGGIVFTLAGTRSMFASRLPRRYWPQQLGFIAALLATFAFELESGIKLLHNPRNTSAADLLCDLLIILLIIGIARAWELVGDRDTGIVASILALAGRDSNPDDPQGVKDGGELRPSTALVLNDASRVTQRSKLGCPGPGRRAARGWRPYPGHPVMQPRRARTMSACRRHEDRGPGHPGAVHRHHRTPRRHCRAGSTLAQDDRPRRVRPCDPAPVRPRTWGDART
jgi:hypothetical protein